MLLEFTEHFKKKNDLKKPKKGFVVENNDPLKIGRVKVTIKGLFEDESNNYEKLPWVSCIAPLSFSGKGNIIAPPEIGSCLKIIWVEDDIYFPAYDGYWLDQTNSPVVADGFYSEFMNNYPNVKGWQDDYGNYEIFNTENESYERNFTSGVNEKISGDGDYTLNIPNIGKIKSTDLNLGNTDQTTKALVLSPHLDRYDSLITALDTALLALVFLDSLFGGAYTSAVLNPWNLVKESLYENNEHITENTKAN